MDDVPREIVDAAIAAGELHGRPVVELSLTLIAEHSGMSRSTLLRRIGVLPYDVGRRRTGRGRRSG